LGKFEVSDRAVSACTF